MGGPFNSDFVDIAPPPSLAALLEKATLVFIGEVGPVQQRWEMIRYEDGRLLIPEPDDIQTLRAMWGIMAYPATDFRLVVEEVLRDDGSIAAGKPIILRVLGHVTPELKESSRAGFYPVTYTGDRYLFLLTPYPDGETYGFFYGPWSRLLVDGDLLLASTGPPQLLQLPDLDGPLTLDALIRHLAADDNAAGAVPTPAP